MNIQSNTRPRTAFLLIAVPVGIWLVWDALSYRLVTYSLWADYWEHSAALTEWMRNLAAPGNPHLADGSGSSRYVPVFLVLAAVGRVFGLNAIDLMSISSILNYVLLALGIYLFCKEYFRDEWAPLLGFLVLFTAWGVPWIWSNLYHLRSFFMVSGYPSSFVFALSLIAFWYTLRFLRFQTSVLLGIVFLVLLSALMFVSHALTGVFGIVGCCLLACTERGVPLSLRALVILSMLSGALVSDLWPYFSVWDVVLNKSDVVDDRTWQSFQGFSAMLDRARSGAWWHMLYDPRQLIVALGLALLGLPLCLWLLIKRQQFFILGGLTIMAVPYLGNIFYQIALAHRFLFYIVFFLHLAIIWGVIQLRDRWLQARTAGDTSVLLGTGYIATMGLFVIALVANVYLLFSDFRGMHLNQKLEWVDKRQFLPAGATVVDVYTELTNALPESAVVIGNAKLTWPLPTFRGKVVSLPENHENSLVPDESARIAAETLFMGAGATDAERRGVIAKYDVTHVLVNTTNTTPELLQWLQAYAAPVAVVERYSMYAL